MSLFNDPLFGDSGQPGTVDNQSAFPELYIRNYLNDEGLLPCELTPLLNRVDQFTAIASQVEFTLSLSPDHYSAALVYLNGVPQYPTVNYVINERTINFPPDIIQVGDFVTVKYNA